MNIQPCTQELNINKPDTIYRTAYNISRGSIKSTMLNNRMKTENQPNELGLRKTLAKITKASNVLGLAISILPKSVALVRLKATQWNIPHLQSWIFIQWPEGCRLFNPSLTYVCQGPGPLILIAFLYVSYLFLVHSYMPTEIPEASRKEYCGFPRT